MPWLASSPSLRTHRVRPPDKTTLRAIPGLVPARPLCLGPPTPWKGVAPHARGERLTATEARPPLNHRLLACPSAVLKFPGHSFGLAMRTRGARPSKKNGLSRTVGYAPQARLCWADIARGGAGSARPQGNLKAPRYPIPARPLARHPNLHRDSLPGTAKRCFGMGTSLKRGRTEWLPRRKHRPGDLVPSHCQAGFF